MGNFGALAIDQSASSQSSALSLRRRRTSWPLELKSFCLGASRADEDEEAAEVPVARRRAD